MTFPRPRLSASARGLGYAHKQERAALLPLAYGKPCAYCTLPMERGQELDLDHSVPRALGGHKAPRRIVHRRCNRLAGARLGGKLAQAKTRQARPSRQW